MKAIGYVQCAECEVIQRGYAPRNWKRGEELCTWLHRIVGMEDGYLGGRTKCPGSYKPGKNTRLDSDRRMAAGEPSELMQSYRRNR